MVKDLALFSLGRVNVEWLAQGEGDPDLPPVRGVRTRGGTREGSGAPGAPRRSGQAGGGAGGQDSLARGSANQDREQVGVARTASNTVSVP